MTDKRPLSPPPPPSSSANNNNNELAVSSAKRPRTTTTSSALVPAGAAAAAQSNAGGAGVPRTSSLAAPTMRLTGHVGEVFAAAFSSPSPSFSSDNENVLLASGGYDRSVLLWRAEGECDNVACLRGHKNAVLSLSWFGGGGSSAAVVLSSSADGTARAWDVERGRQIKKATEHGTSVVNCVSAASSGGGGGGGSNAPPLFVTASDDGTARVWDMRVRRSVATLGESAEDDDDDEEEQEQEDDDDETDPRERRRQRRRRRQRSKKTKSGFPLLACAISPSADSAYTSGIDGVVRAWDLRRTSQAALTLVGHSDMVTSLALRPTSDRKSAPTHLLSNSADRTLRSWDVRPFAPSERCSRAYVGAAHSLERNLLRCCWSGVDPGTGDVARWVAAGSSDGVAYVWDAKTAKLEYALPGHSGSVNDVCFHPTEPVIASASSDGTLFVGELAS